MTWMSKYILELIRWNLLSAGSDEAICPNLQKESSQAHMKPQTIVNSSYHNRHCTAANSSPSNTSQMENPAFIRSSPGAKLLAKGSRFSREKRCHGCLTNVGQTPAICFQLAVLSCCTSAPSRTRTSHDLETAAFVPVSSRPAPRLVDLLKKKLLVVYGQRILQHGADPPNLWPLQGGQVSRLG